MEGEGKMNFAGGSEMDTCEAYTGFTLVMPPWGE